MPNEQTSVPLYAASEILTAANMNISAGTGVPVFATTVTRDAAFGGASEKVLAEGQLCYLSASNIVQYYDGAAWATVGPAASSGLVCVKAETAFSAVATVSADSVFSSTYTNYLIKVIYTSSTTSALRIQFRAAATATTTNYNRQTLDGTDATAGAGRTANTSSITAALSTNGDFKSSADIQVFGPNLATATTAQVYNAASSGGAYTTPINFLCTGNQSGSTQFDGFQIVPDSGTITGSYTVYGYSKAV